MARRKQPAPAPAPAPPAPPPALPLAARQGIQRVLHEIEGTAAKLRDAGAFEILAVLVKAGHALKLTADHAAALELYAGIGPAGPDRTAAAGGAEHSNGVKRG
jgi:hypothetical protein